MGYSREIYKSVREDLANLRRSSKSELEKRKKDAYIKCPKLKEINREISLTALKAAKIILNGANVAEELKNLKEKSLKLKETQDRLLLSLGLPIDYLSAKYKCTYCKDEGYVDGKMCSCIKQMLRNKAYNELNKLSPLSLSSFDTFDLSYYPIQIEGMGISPRSKMEKIFNYCKKYSYEFKPNCQSLFLQGPPGLGKTHLSLAIAKTVINKGFGVVYGSVPNIISKLEKEKFTNSPESNTESLLVNCDLLILDDLGTEFSTSFSNAAIYNIVNSRILMNKPIIISTNLTTKELEHEYSTRIVSRIMGSMLRLDFVGEDMRQVQNRILMASVKSSMAGCV